MDAHPSLGRANGPNSGSTSEELALATLASTGNLLGTPGALGAPELETVELAPPPPRRRLAPRRAVDPRAPLFVAGLVAVLSVLWIFAAQRNGSWRQTPFWDLAWFHNQALRILAAFEQGGISGLADAWAHTSNTHAPLVPTLSALFMAVLGPSRAAAELVLPLFSFVLLLSTFRSAERLFDRKTAYAAAALVTTFPVFLTYSRLYFFEIALAANLAASAWAVLASEGFSRWKPALAFGVLAGLTALSRSMGFVYLAGLGLVALADVARRSDRAPRFLRLGVASAIAVALAATWYVPNFREIFGYIFAATYGPDAQLYSGSSSAFSLGNVLYYLEWLVLDGPGVPIAAIALVAWAGCAIARRGAGLLSLPVVALLAFCAIDFFGAAAGAQRMAGKFLLPIMPAVAILVVRAVVNVPFPALRKTLAASIAALGLYSWVASSFLFPVDPSEPAIQIQGSAPGAHLARLWNHRDFYWDWSRQGGGNPRLDYKVGETMDRLEAIPTRHDGGVAVWGENVFFDGGPLELEAMRRRNAIHFWNPPGLRNAQRAGFLEDVTSALAQCPILLYRDANDVVSRTYGEALRALNDGQHFKYVRLEEPVGLGDGSKVWIYCRPPRFVPTPGASAPAGSPASAPSPEK